MTGESSGGCRSVSKVSDDVASQRMAASWIEDRVSASDCRNVKMRQHALEMVVVVGPPSRCRMWERMVAEWR